MDHNNKMSGRLNIVMKMFGISGKDLSNIIHVDESLISKWRSGKRELKSASDYVDTIVAFFMSCDEESNFSNLIMLLSADHPESASAGREEIAACLKHWLTSEADIGSNDKLFNMLSNNENVGISISYHFKKNAGRRQAIRFFNEYALKQKEPLELISVTTEDGTWFNEDEEFVSEWLVQYFDIIKAGHIIKIIHPVNRGYDQIASSMANWLPIHMTGKTVDYYIPNYSDDSIAYTYFIIPGHIALYGSSSRMYTKNINTWLTNDPVVVKNMTNIVQESLNRSNSLFTRFYLNSSEAYLNELIGMLQRRNTRYFHGSSLYFVSLSEDLLHRIFSANQMSDGEVEKAVRMYQTLSALNVSIKNRYILNFRSLRESLLKDQVELHNLTYLIGRRIIADANTYREVLDENFSMMLDSDMIEVGLLDPARKDDFENINVLAQENTEVQFIATNTENPVVMIMHEMTFVVAMMEKIKKIWDRIPTMMKDKEYVFQQMKNLEEETK